jgi:hypothetical protein
MQGQRTVPTAILLDDEVQSTRVALGEDTVLSKICHIAVVISL